MVAILNGAFRQAVILPRTGAPPAHVISALLLSAAIVLVTWLSLSWMAPVRASDALRIGLLWAALTIAFEFLAGHFLFGNPWSALLADYDVTRGRIWPLVLVVTAAAPWVVFTLSARR